MDFDKWIQYGWPTVALAGVGLFVWKLGWPFLVRQIERAQDMVQKNTEEFTKALSRRDEQELSFQRELLNRFDTLINNKPRQHEAKKRGFKNE